VCSGQPPALRMSIESVKSTDSNKKTIRSWSALKGEFGHHPEPKGLDSKRRN
jgi:hypothetical protein